MIKLHKKLNSINGPSVAPRRLLPKLLIISCLVFWGASVLGPYDWKVYSTEGILFYAFLYLMLFFGLVSGFIRPSRFSNEYKAFDLDSRQRNILIIVSTLSVFCWIYEMFGLFVLHAGAFNLLAGEASEYNATRTTLDQVALIFMQLGTSSYILWKFSSENKSKGIVRLIIGLGFWTAGTYYVMFGQRFVLAVEFIVFITIWLMQGGMRKNTAFVRLHKKRFLILAGLLGIVIMVAFLYVFANRIHTGILLKSELFPGDQSLKPWAYQLYIASNGNSLVEALYMLADYMGEAPYVFSGLWEYYLPASPIPFLNEVRPFIQAFSLFGFPSYLELVDSLGGLAKYSGIGWSLITDFGVWFAPFVSFMFGFMFSIIEKFKDNSYLARALYPCAIGCVLFAPIYYFTVGRTDYTVYGILFLWVLLILVRKNSSQKTKTRESREL